MSGEVEFSVRCPDGEVWDDISSTPPDEQTLAEWSQLCGCELDGPHVVVTRTIPEWREARY